MATNTTLSSDPHAVYHRKFVKHFYDGYIGVMKCPRCGKKGYMKRGRIENIKNGVIYAYHFFVIHQHKEHGVNVYDGACHIGYSKNREAFN